MLTKRILKLLIVAGVVCLGFTSCKDDEEESRYVSGTLSFDLPIYAFPGESFDVEASGIVSPKGDSVSYQFVGKAFDPDTLVAASGRITVPYTCGTYTLTLYAKAVGYLGTSTSRSVTVIPASYKEAVDGFVVPEHSFTDERDNKVYYYKTYGPLDWFVQNLNYCEVGTSYLGESAQGFLYGSLYSWAQAVTGEQNPGELPEVTDGLGAGPQGVCPQGWSVPTLEDWAQLATSLSGTPVTFFDAWDNLASSVCVDAKVNGAKMWKFHPDNTKTNTSGWNALPAGYGSMAGDFFTGQKLTSFWWTSRTEASQGKAYYRYVHYAQGGFPFAQTDKYNVYASVRCVRLSAEATQE